MMLLTKELNEKDRNLKKQLLISTKDDKTPSECILAENGFSRDVKSDFNIHKIDFPENVLIYINPAQLTNKKEAIIYCTYVILGQIVPLSNPPQDLDNYVCKENEIKILAPLCNKANVKFKGIEKHCDILC